MSMWYLLELLLDAKAGRIIALKADAEFEKTSISLVNRGELSCNTKVF